MILAGTSDEIMYIMLQCQKRTEPCETCVLHVFCKPEMFKRMKPSDLESLETGKRKPILIQKGDII